MTRSHSLPPINRPNPLIVLSRARAMEKSRVLVVGSTGYIGRRLVRASLAQGHPTLVLLRPEIGLDIDKLQMLPSLEAQGARLVEASLEDHKWGTTLMVA
jgi:nucleoside-diphosphate-sugar epimerase